VGSMIADGYESNRIEFKRELTENFEREVIAFLNYQEGGLLYFGVDDSGEVIGLDEIDIIQRKVADRIKNNILPATLGLFDVVAENYDGKDILKVVVSSGSEKPYYLRKYGMSPTGCFVRVGSSAQPMTTRMIDELYATRVQLRLGNILSPRQKLSFQ
jgi:predicted HTH transcriptional regulator